MNWLFIICIIYIICFMYITVNPFAIDELKYKIKQYQLELEEHKRLAYIQQKRREGNDSLSFDDSDLD